MKTETKQCCVTCKVWRPWRAFSKNRTKATGYARECKSCNHFRYERLKQFRLESALAVPVIRV